MIPAAGSPGITDKRNAYQNMNINFMKQQRSSSQSANNNLSQTSFKQEKSVEKRSNSNNSVTNQ